MWVTSETQVHKTDCIPNAACGLERCPGPSGRKESQAVLRAKDLARAHLWNGMINEQGCFQGTSVSASSTGADTRWHTLITSRRQLSFYLLVYQRDEYVQRRFS